MTCDPVALALAAAQEAARATLRDTCTVVGKGERLETAYGYEYAETTATYPCSVLAHTGEREFLAGGKVTSTYDTTILLPLTAQVSPRNHITAGGNRYEVVATDAGRTGALTLAVATKKAGEP
jgi:hypothetical protein